MGRLEADLQVLHLIPSLRGGGAEALARTLVARLPEYGIDAQVWALHGDVSAVVGARSLRGRCSSDPRLTARLRRTLQAQLQRCGAAAPTLVIHTHLGWPLYHTRVALRGLDLPWVHTEHSTSNVRRRALLRGIESWAYAGTDCVFGVSDAVSEALSAWLGAAAPATEVVLNGVRPFGAGRERVREGPLRVLSIGALVPHKGFDTAIAALAQVPAAWQQYRILGEGRELAALQGLAVRLGVGERVRFDGWVDDIEPALRWADVLLLPARREGFGLAAVEAMSAGVPVLGSDVPGLREVLVGAGAGAQRLPVDDAHAWAAALRAFAAMDVATYAASSAAAVAHAERFSQDAMVERYADRYRAVAAARAGRWRR
jgi:glycosyltransferase involved in cell wall biosynthesis